MKNKKLMISNKEVTANRKLDRGDKLVKFACVLMFVNCYQKAQHYQH